MTLVIYQLGMANLCFIISMSNPQGAGGVGSDVGEITSIDAGGDHLHRRHRRRLFKGYRYGPFMR